ncbi:GNAT family N-acetyltransferase [Methanobacterium petrolearium]|uniref:GNAT family N-acetyltransferase n=1 Tax=Methanobacterium petrolearium TaxID=710190 RepID=UPI001AE4F677|nr:GNAT family N-acetyltransferase [Methanobacterium petrolearium]MBP1946568.1 ribosomal protein S18 acetylase RimI-like enzyme [Methanobacterium petrolearium]BDZ69915.1 N-acetyltransferase [Methanobacterium petrolearium]
MVNVRFIDTGPEALGLVQPLWEKLNKHHLNQKSDFQEYYANFTFPERKEVLLKKSNNKDMLISLAEDKDLGILVAYCITTISRENEGEIDSIYVEEKYRSLGVGRELMKRSLMWMDEKGTKIRKVMVAIGNQEAVSFYEGYGFHPRALRLEQPINHDKKVIND